MKPFLTLSREFLERILSELRLAASYYGEADNIEDIQSIQEVIDRVEQMLAVK